LKVNVDWTAVFEYHPIRSYWTDSSTPILIKHISFQHHPFSFDDQPISVKSSIVDIAYDYSKKKNVKKNVFRLKTYNGSEYLFQADDQESMMSWIQAIQTNN